jgi:hypothetical protein
VYHAAIKILATKKFILSKVLMVSQITVTLTTGLLIPGNGIPLTVYQLH